MITSSSAIIVAKRGRRKTNKIIPTRVVRGINLPATTKTKHTEASQRWIPSRRRQRREVRSNPLPFPCLPTGIRSNSASAAAIPFAIASALACFRLVAANPNRPVCPDRTCAPRDAFCPPRAFGLWFLCWLCRGDAEQQARPDECYTR